MKNIIFILIIAFFISCKPAPKQEKQPIKIIVFADKTGSIKDNSIPKLKKENLQKLLDYIKENGGELALSDITHISKDNLITIKNIPKPVLQQGETAEEFNKRIKKWKKKSPSFDIDNFFSNSKVISILNYSKLYNATNIADAIDLANLYLNTKNIFFNSNIKQIAIFITDGKDNVKNQFPNKFCCKLYMISRSSNAETLKSFNPIIHPSIESAIDEIINLQ